MPTPNTGAGNIHKVVKLRAVLPHRRKIHLAQLHHFVGILEPERVMRVNKLSDLFSIAINHHHITPHVRRPVLIPLKQPIQLIDHATNLNRSHSLITSHHYPFLCREGGHSRSKLPVRCQPCWGP